MHVPEVPERHIVGAHLKVFADLHHTSLFYSLQLLFEKRLGWKLFRPIGIEWYNKGKWLLYPGVHQSTAKQYLTLETCFKRDVHGFALPERMKLNDNYTVEDGIYYVEDPSSGKVHRGITLEKFIDTKFDILISSVPSHIPIWNQLIAEYQPRAKHIFQVGNAWGFLPGVSNILASTSPFGVPGHINACFYHQEFDTNIFCYTPPVNHKKVYSYIHYMRELDLHCQYRDFLQPKGWSFNTFGAGMEHDLCYMGDIADKCKEMGWLWHIKGEGDGFGHTLHNAYACGRPAIIKKHYYANKLAEALLIDGQTCVDISGKSIHETDKILSKLAEPEEHTKICERSHNRFNEVVNFDHEFEKIKKFLSSLL